MRGISRVYGVSRNTLVAWLKKKVESLPEFEETLLPAEPEDNVELDELWSFVGNKKEAWRVWIALCKRTRQVIAWVLGRRDYTSCRQLRRNIPKEYQHCRYYSDQFRFYKYCFPKSQLSQVKKQSGLTNHVERWNNTLRQRIGRFVRKSLSFSKSIVAHYRALKLFIYDYNLSVISHY